MCLFFGTEKTGQLFVDASGRQDFYALPRPKSSRTTLRASAVVPRLYAKRSTRLQLAAEVARSMQKPDATQKVQRLLAEHLRGVGERGAIEDACAWIESLSLQDEFTARQNEHFRTEIFGGCLRNALAAVSGNLARLLQIDVSQTVLFYLRCQVESDESANALLPRILELQQNALVILWQTLKTAQDLGVQECLDGWHRAAKFDRLRDRLDVMLTTDATKAFLTPLCHVAPNERSARLCAQLAGEQKELYAIFRGCPQLRPEADAGVDREETQLLADFGAYALAQVTHRAEAEAFVSWSSSPAAIREQAILVQCIEEVTTGRMQRIGKDFAALVERAATDTAVAPGEARR